MPEPPPTSERPAAARLADELALVVWGADGALPGDPADRWVTWALGALLLADLEAAGRLTVTEPAVVVVDDERTDDELLDAALDVAQAHPTDAARTIALVTKEIPRLPDRLGIALGEQGRATPVRRSRLLPVRSGWRAEPAALAALLDELRAAVAGSVPLDRRRALLVGAVAETGQTGLVVGPTTERADALPVIAEATARSPLTRTLRRMVRADAERQGLLG